MLDITRFNNSADIARARQLHRRGLYLLALLIAWPIAFTTAMNVLFTLLEVHSGFYVLNGLIAIGIMPYYLGYMGTYLPEHGKLPGSDAWVKSQVKSLRHEEAVLDREIADGGLE